MLVGGRCRIDIVINFFFNGDEAMGWNNGVVVGDDCGGGITLFMVG